MCAMVQGSAPPPRPLSVPPAGGDCRPRPAASHPGAWRGGCRGAHPCQPVWPQELPGHGASSVPAALSNTLQPRQNESDPRFCLPLARRPALPACSCKTHRRRSGCGQSTSRGCMETRAAGTARRWSGWPTGSTCCSASISCRPWPTGVRVRGGLGREAAAGWLGGWLSLIDWAAPLRPLSV